MTEYLVHHVVQGAPGVDGNRPGRTHAVLISRQLAALVLASVSDTAEFLVSACQSCQHRRLVNLQQEHLSEAIGQLQLSGSRDKADLRRGTRDTSTAT